jgi:RNA polymerase sigma-70 factor (ECF subfamily)
VAKLPARTREILLLSKFDGITQAEIARRLRLSEKSVQYHIKRAVDFCTAYFHAQGHDFF